MEKLPVIYVDHGSPMRIMTNNPINKELSKIWQKYKNDISSILIISAHWVTQWIHITSAEKLETIYDFYWFPDELYEMKYDVNGDMDLTTELKEKFGFIADGKRGIDHGAWTVLKQMFPEGDIPVVQLSLDYIMSQKDHFELGKKLTYLREKGVLIIASGSIVHNLSFLNFDENMVYPWALDFNNHVKNLLIKKDFESILKLKDSYKNFEMNVPTFEHFAPFLYAIWLHLSDDSIAYFSEGINYGAVSNNGIIIWE